MNEELEELINRLYTKLFQQELKQNLKGLEIDIDELDEDLKIQVGKLIIEIEGENGEKDEQE